MFKKDDIVVFSGGRYRLATPAEIAAFEARPMISSKITWKGSHTQTTISTTSSIFWKEIDLTTSLLDPNEHHDE